MDPTEVIRQARLAAGMTQEELATRSGIAQPNLAAYEAGRRRPSQAMLSRILGAARLRPSMVVAAHREEIIDVARANRAGDVRVFGSIARGQDTPDSDVDLLVRFQPGASLFDLIQLTDQLETLLAVRVDVVSEAGLDDRHQEIREQATAL